MEGDLIMAMVVDGAPFFPCGPCAATACCLYPWPDPDGTIGGPYYPDTDLPDSITVTITGGVTPGVYTFTRVLTEYRYTCADPAMAGSEIRAGANDGVDPAAWVAAIGFYGTTPMPCLISDYSAGVVVTDMFMTAYTLTINGESHVVTRTSPSSCDWFGTGSGGGAGTEQWAVQYRDPRVLDPGETMWSYSGYGVAGGNKDSDMTKPDGSYDSGFAIVS